MCKLLDKKKKVLKRLTEVEEFEKFIHKTFVIKFFFFNSFYNCKPFKFEFVSINFNIRVYRCFSSAVSEI